MQQTVRQLRNFGKRTTRHLAFGNRSGYRLEDIGLPASHTTVAAATCRFYLHGLNTNGNEWGNGARCFMQTFGKRPNLGPNAIQNRHGWIETDSHEAADAILRCFDLSIDAVYAHYGKPAEGQALTLDLMEIVAALHPDLMEVTH